MGILTRAFGATPVGVRVGASASVAEKAVRSRLVHRQGASCAKRVPLILAPKTTVQLELTEVKA